MHRPARSLGVLAALAVASLVATGCGESVDDAKGALCADIATLRADVEALGELDATSSYDEFREARQNVRESFRDAAAAADNVDADEFDAVEDAWDELDDELGDIDSASDLRDDFDDLRAAFDSFVAAARDARGAVDCSDTGE
jgi:hypothetical protein